MSLLEVRGLTKSYGRELALAGADLRIEAGEKLVLLGPSGCGKSTLLRLIAGLEQADSGQIILGGDDITALPAHKRPVNMMFQSYALFPHLSVADNIRFGLKREGLPAAEIEARLGEAMAMLEIAAFNDRKPHQLSGGQAQRVALARALVKRPRLLLLDEPLAALDKRLRLQTQAELRRINRETGIGFIFVTHDSDEAMALADRIAVMRAGRIRQVGSPQDIYERPIDRFVAALTAEVNILRDTDGRLMGIRPEQVRLTAPDAPETRAGVIADIDYGGGNSLIAVTLDDGNSIKAHPLNRPGESLPALGQRVGVAWDRGALFPLNEDEA